MNYLDSSKVLKFAEIITNWEYTGKDKSRPDVLGHFRDFILYLLSCESYNDSKRQFQALFNFQIYFKGKLIYSQDRFIEDNFLNQAYRRAEKIISQNSKNIIIEGKRRLDDILSDKILDYQI